MSHLATELQKLRQLYIVFGEELDGALSIADPDGAQAFVNTVLESRNRLAQIEQINAQVSQLAGTWEKSHNYLTPESSDEIQNLMETVRTQAVQLEKLCGIHAQKLEAVRDMLGKELAQIGKGSRYLKSIKPAKQNYPKFVDSFI